MKLSSHNLDLMHGAAANLPICDAITKLSTWKVDDNDTGRKHTMAHTLRLWIALTAVLIGMASWSTARADQIGADPIGPDKAGADRLSAQVESALSRAGDNRRQLERALQAVDLEQRRGMRFLIAFMPQRDLQAIDVDLLIENVQYAYRAWNESTWKQDAPEDVFLNDVLPYASVSERRDRWRRQFFEKFKPLVKDAQSPSEAAVILNQKIFPLLNVKYSTKRRRADQGPLESMETGLASCTGLSILLIDACRAVGVPARLVATPLWSDRSGNHTWVEVWDNGWHFTGAAEPTGNELDEAWFLGRASQADREHKHHAIYAVSYRKTPQSFPMVWARGADYVQAVNVTDRYVNAARKLPDSRARIMFRALRTDGNRCRATVQVRDAAGKVVFQGRTNDDRFDRNDHVTAELKLGENYDVEFKLGNQRVTRKFKVDQKGKLISVELPSEAADSHEADSTEADSREDSAANSHAAVVSLKAHLAIDRDKRPGLVKQSFANTPLTKDDAQAAARLLRSDHRDRVRAERAEEMKARVLTYKNMKMPFFYKVFGEKPDKGRSLFISMHGGGGATKRVNDSQWKNQQRLYAPKEGVYVAPRAPTDTWNLWHQGHIDPLFRRLIENLIVFEDVDPDRVYLLGYSAGGDGVYQLAPRMADRLAAASMMAGHPNETSPLGLRNLPFSLHVGGNDGAYQRNKIARQWKQKLDELSKADPEGYVHWAKVYEGKGHWLNREDAAAVPWMAKFTRNRYPDQIVWKQDDVTHGRFYWLAVSGEQREPRSEIRARRDGQQFEIEKCDVAAVTLRLNDDFVDLDQPIVVAVDGTVRFEGVVNRTIGMLGQTLEDRGDPTYMFSARIVVETPQ